MSQSITSAVAVPPMLWIPHQLVGAPLGYSVTLECYTEAHPTSLNYWAREDGLMIHESSKYKATSLPDRPSYKMHMTLTIFDIQVSKCLSLCISHVRPIACRIECVVLGKKKKKERTKTPKIRKSSTTYLYL